MCGICGFVGLDDKGLLNKMVQVIEHRGPDNKGIFVDNNLGLGYTRLTIIDTNEQPQPILHNEDESIFISFNGELYNYLELRKELEPHHKFYTNTDTEVVVHAYEQYPLEEFLNKLRGMYAFAIYDKNKESLLLVRDRLGIKPLYYYEHNNQLFFASEIKSLLQNPEIKPEINYPAINDYLSYRFVSGPETMLKGIKKLLPGTYLLVSKETPPHISSYWQYSPEPKNSSESYLAQHLSTLLSDVTKIHLRSDVPLGVFLSGGIDSSAIVALMREQGIQDIHTFSIIFEEDPVKEGNYASMMADAFSIDHHELRATKDIVFKLPEAVWFLDDPIVDAVSVSKLALSEFTSKHVKVALTGEGGDEAFGGYVHYKTINNLNNYFSKFGFIMGSNAFRKLASSFPVSFYDNFFDYPYSIGEKGKERIQDFLSALGNEADAYLTFISLFSGLDKQNALHKNNKEKILTTNLTKALQKDYFSQNTNLVDKIIQREMHSWLPDYILLQQDKLTMAHGLEGRVPYLDHKLIEFTSRMPHNMKVRGKQDKYLFRKIMLPKLPQKIAARKKHPFFIPIDSWVASSMKELYNSVCSSPEFLHRGIFSKQYIDKILEQHNRSKLIYSRQLWAVIALEIWMESFIDRNSPTTPIKL